jgi:glyoxylase-like metal-dependent hydrolase (beta-lactamase superfamily II)
MKIKALMPNLWVLENGEHRYLYHDLIIDPPDPSCLSFVQAHHPSRLVVLHAHDAKGAGFWKEHLGLKVWIHPADAASLDCLPDGFLQDGEYILPNTQVIHIPGHTPGSVMLLAREDKQGLLFSGDSLIGKDQAIYLPPAQFSYNQEQLKESVQKLLAFDFDSLLPARGEMILQDAKEKMAMILN